MGNSNREVEAWEQLEDEGPKPYEAFLAYRDMGRDRSLGKVSRQLGKSSQLMDRWSSKNRWVARVDAWDKEQDRIKTIERQRAIADMERRHADTALAWLTKAVARLQAIDIETISPGDLARWIDGATKLERLSRGVATENVSTEVYGRGESGAIEVRTYDEYARLAAIADITRRPDSDSASPGQEEISGDGEEMGEDDYSR